MGKIRGEAYHAYWQDQNGKHLNRWGHGALCQPLEESRCRAGDLLEHCWCGTHIGILVWDIVKHRKVDNV